jgi:hypothetical protein
MRRKVIILEFKAVESCPLHWFYKETLHFIKKSFFIANNNPVLRLPWSSTWRHSWLLSEALLIKQKDVNKTL